MSRAQSPPPNPSPIEQQVLAAIRRAGHAGITSQQLAIQLGIRDKAQRYVVFDAIDALLDAGRIRSGKKGRYISSQNRDEAEGTIDIIASGGGYVRWRGMTRATTCTSTRATWAWRCMVTG